MQYFILNKGSLNCVIAEMTDFSNQFQTRVVLSLMLNVNRC